VKRSFQRKVEKVQYLDNVAVVPIGLEGENQAPELQEILLVALSRIVSTRKIWCNLIDSLDDCQNAINGVIFPQPEPTVVTEEQKDEQQA
jgi:hypothetical protein